MYSFSTAKWNENIKNNCDLSVKHIDKSIDRLERATTCLVLWYRRRRHCRPLQQYSNSNTSNYRIISSQQYTNWSIKYPPFRSLCINHAIRNIYMARSHTHAHISLTYSYTQNAGSSMACIHPPFNLTSAIAAIPITHASCPLRRAVPKAHGIFHSAENVYEQHTIHIRGMAFPLPLLYFFFLLLCFALLPHLYFQIDTDTN